MSFGRPGGFGRDFFGDRPKPVKVGEELDVTIEAVASKGDGIAKKEGFVIFVPGTSAGEKVRIKVTFVKNKCAVAEKVGAAGAAPAAAASEEAPAEAEAAGEPVAGEEPAGEVTEAAEDEGEEAEAGEGDESGEKSA